jgi:hypothetical protein
MNPNSLFIDRCEQMAQLLASHKQVELLDLSAILRQLLFDAKSLVDTVNTKPYKLRFHVGMWRSDPSGTTLAALEDGLDPETSPPGKESTVVTRAQFASYPVVFFQGQRITVKDVIRYAANVAGGVHHDPQPAPEFLVMQGLSQQFGIGGLPLGIRTLKPIGRVSLRALRPVIDYARKRP